MTDGGRLTELFAEARCSGGGVEQIGTIGLDGRARSSSKPVINIKV